MFLFHLLLKILLKSQMFTLLFILVIFLHKFSEFNKTKLSIKFKKNIKDIFFMISITSKRIKRYEKI